MKVVLDIETIQTSREEWARLTGKQDSSRSLDFPQEGYDLFEACAAEERRRLEDEQYAKSAFDATFSTIVCIGLLEFSDQLEPRGAIAWYGGNERELLRQFWSRLAQNRPALFITHNGLGFDPVYDTMAVWSNWDTRGWVKLDVLARALNVETKSGSGEQVAVMWEKGQGVELARYCLQDTYVTYACYCRMNFRQPLSSEVVLLQPELVDVG
jgi:hypothetical protein